MRVIFMGTPDFAVQTLRALHEAGHEICLVVTQPDKPRGRHGELQRSDVGAEADRLGIETITPKRIRTDEETKARLRALAPDVMVVTAFGQILTQEILDIPKYGCINVHASLLPKYRGASPIQWAILNGDTVSGVTTMQMDAGIDTGAMLLKETLVLDPKETGGSLFEKLAVLGGELIVKTLEAVEAGTLQPEPQDETKATKVGMFTKASGVIDWKDSAAVIERKIRGLNPWPSAYTWLKGKVLKLWDADLVEETVLTGLEPVAQLGRQEDVKAASGQPGSVYTDGKQLFVVCGSGVLKLNELQLEGKRRMETEMFLRGYQFS